MVLGQTLKTAGSCETLGQHDPDGDCDLVLLSGWPSVDILQETREGGLFKRFLEILVSEEL